MVISATRTVGRFLLALLTLLVSGMGFAQSEDMNVWLNTGTDEQRLQRLMQIGVARDIAENPVKGSVSPQIRWLPLSQPDFAVLFIPCQLDSAYLHLAMHTEAGWRVVDRMEFDCHYDESVAVEDAHVRKAETEIFVHHACEGRGTGYVEQNFEVIDVAGGKLKTVLNVEEVHSESAPDGTYDLDQHSTFVIVPSRTYSRAIEETRSIDLNGKLSVQRRYFHWSTATKRYEVSKFTSVNDISD